VPYLLNIDTALGTIHSALLPLGCSTEIYDHEKVRLRVLDPNGQPLLDITDLFVPHLLDLQNLRVSIQRICETIERLGFMLKTWSCPC